MKPAFRSLLGLALLIGCSDSGSRSGLSPVSGPSLDHVSEGRFGGNADFFFGTPLAANPQPGDVNFDVGGSNGLLVPYLRICETDGAPSAAGCVNDVTLAMTGSATGLSMIYGATAELYQVNWKTRDLVVGKDYRIEIWGVAFSTAAEKAALDPRWLFGWRDIRNSPSVASCSGSEAFCNINYGKTLPVKVRIEQFVFCPTTRTCAVQFVAAGSDATLEVQLDPDAGAPNAQLHIPGQAGTNFALAFEPCTPEEDAAVSEAIDIPTFGPCLKTETTFSGRLGTPAIVSLCSEFDASTFGLSDEQEQQLALHHFASDLSAVTALPEAWQCESPTAGAVAGRAPNALLRLASSVGNRLASLVTPRPLFAAARRIDRGGGGETDEIASFFKLALPAKFEFVVAADAFATGMAGAPFLARARVTDLHGVAVQNARVHWTVVSSPAPGASLTSVTPQYTDASGIAEATVTLSSTPGINLIRASGRGIAARSNGDCPAPSVSTGSCNGPRLFYDPFLPMHVPEFDASGTEAAVIIPEGTRLSFSVKGASPPQ